MRISYLLKILFLGIVVLIGVTSCAPTKVETIQHYQGARLPKPNEIVVYNFEISPDDVTLNKAIGARIVNSVTGRTENQQIKVAQSVADSLSKKLITEFRALGLPARRANAMAPIPANALLITGSFENVDQGNRLRRMVVGFGAGRTQVATQVRVLESISDPATLVYSFQTLAKSSAKPGIGPMSGIGAATGHLATSAAASSALAVTSEVLGASVEDDAKRTAKQIVKKLKPFFVAQGWIN